MEKTYYVITGKPTYFELLKKQSDRVTAADEADALPQRMVVTITQGGFGQDVIDDDRQTKERFLEYLFDVTGVDFPRSEEAFDQYFELERVELIDLDE
jgi:hypothetical protein